MLNQRIIRSFFKKNIQYGIRYTKKFFQQIENNPQQIQKRHQQQFKKQTLYQSKGNQKNPDVCIKNLKNASTILNVTRQFDLKNRVNQCAILTPEPKKQKILITAKRKYIITSIKKARLALFPIRKRHIIDAIQILQNSQKKVGKLMLVTLKNLITHAIQQNKDPIRLFVHGYLIGKTQRYKSIRYHAKGKMGRQKRDFCQVKIILQQKDEDQFYSDIGTGQSPPGFATFIRQRLISINAGYEKLVMFSGITTAKGRQQKRQIMKRKLHYTMKKNEEQGTFIPKKTIIKELAQKEGQRIKGLLKHELRDKNQSDYLKLREQVYKKNMGLQ